MNTQMIDTTVRVEYAMHRLRWKLFRKRAGFVKTNLLTRAVTVLDTTCGAFTILTYLILWAIVIIFASRH